MSRRDAGIGKVYIGGLPDDAKTYELEDVFCKYGKIRKVWIARRPPGFAFVEFMDNRDAEDAVRKLDGSKICGVRVRVELAHGNNRIKNESSNRRRYNRRSRSPRYSRYSRSRSRSRSPPRKSSKSETPVSDKKSPSCTKDISRENTRSRSHTPVSENNSEHSNRSRSPSSESQSD
uniref:Serine/arginine-rich splicing factor 3 (inferred by orthology to a human protein) n=1 Tax=Strongyloides venezuelensis TaxID=75913 RepID=A0A0K0FWD9_STRVS